MTLFGLSSSDNNFFAACIMLLTMSFAGCFSSSEMFLENVKLKCVSFLLFLFDINRILPRFLSYHVLHFLIMSSSSASISGPFLSAAAIP